MTGSFDRFGNRVDDEDEEKKVGRPKVVCLCGSTRFKDAFAKANYTLTLKRAIVLSIGCDSKTDVELGLDEKTKEGLDELHLRKIDLADSVLVLNVGGYIGISTQREIAYAIMTKKPVEFLNELLGETYLSDNAHELGAEVARLARCEYGEEIPTPKRMPGRRGF